MKLCAFIETEDKQDVAIFTRHGNLFNGLFIHTDVDEQGRPAGHSALMVRFKDKNLGNTVYADLVRREGYSRKTLKKYEELNTLELVRGYLPECVLI